MDKQMLHLLCYIITYHMNMSCDQLNKEEKNRQ